MSKRRKETVKAKETDKPLVVETATYESSLHRNLEEIKNLEGVLGYIIRNDMSASVDISDPNKVMEYATISSAILDGVKRFAETFELGNVKSIVLSCKDLKMLSLSIEENNVIIFMKTSAKTDDILRKISTP